MLEVSESSDPRRLEELRTNDEMPSKMPFTSLHRESSHATNKAPPGPSIIVEALSRHPGDRALEEERETRAEHCRVPGTLLVGP